MTENTVIFWFRNDLRIHDNPALNKALESGFRVIPVYVIEDIWYDALFPELGFPRAGEKRKQFLAESLADLKRNLQQKSSDLLVFKGKTSEILKKVSNATNSVKIIAQKEAAWEEIQIEKEIAQITQLELHWGSMLYQPDQVDFPTEKSPFYYTRFKNKVLAQPFSPLPSSLPSTGSFMKLGKIELNNLPRLFNLENWSITDKSIPFKGGESGGILAMKKYIKKGSADHYADTRNLFEGENFSSRLGAWLANGCLSPRTLWKQLKKKETPKNHQSIQTLLEQLIWRDNFRFLFLRYGHKFFTTSGLRKTPPDMYNDMEGFELWRKGQTGEPIIDALMHQLEATGFMSNRGRMLVSFYLSKEMKINWQWGAAWFESMLVDYDVYSNYGNWAYQSGRGTDSRVNRKFNLQTQTKKFDPRGKFIQKWK